MACFFGAMMLFTACKSKAGAQIHLGFWIAKVLVLLGIFAGTLFLSNDVFAGYAWAARVVSPIFTLFMLTMFIDLGYKVNEKFVEKDESEEDFCCFTNGGNTYKILLILGTLLLFSAAFTGTGFMYSKFGSGGSCTFNSLALTTNLIFGIITSFIGMTKIAPHASIFVSALVTAYTTWMTFSALTSFPVAECNPSLNDSSIGQTILSCVITGVVFALIARNINRWSQVNQEMASGGGVGKVGTEDVRIQLDNAPDAAVAAEVEPQSFGFYHLLMLAVSLYMAMLLTDWGVNHGDAGDNSVDYETTRHNVGYASAWLKISFTWACSSLYLWTLIAPRCCPNRDFGLEQDLEPLCDC